MLIQIAISSSGALAFEIINKTCLLSAMKNLASILIELALILNFALIFLSSFSSPDKAIFNLIPADFNLSNNVEKNLDFDKIS